jgi:hypothetical protein
LPLLMDTFCGMRKICFAWSKKLSGNAKSPILVDEALSTWLSDYFPNGKSPASIKSVFSFRLQHRGQNRSRYLMT